MCSECARASMLACVRVCACVCAGKQHCGGASVRAVTLVLRGVHTFKEFVLLANESR